MFCADGLLDHYSLLPPPPTCVNVTPSNNVLSTRTSVGIDCCYYSKWVRTRLTASRFHNYHLFRCSVLTVLWAWLIFLLRVWQGFDVCSLVQRNTGGLGHIVLARSLAIHVWKATVAFSPGMYCPDTNDDTCLRAIHLQDNLDRPVPEILILLELRMMKWSYKTIQSWPLLTDIDY